MAATRCQDRPCGGLGAEAARVGVAEADDELDEGVDGRRAGADEAVEVVGGALAHDVRASPMRAVVTANRAVATDTRVRVADQPVLDLYDPGVLVPYGAALDLTAPYGSGTTKGPTSTVGPFVVRVRVSPCAREVPCRLPRARGPRGRATRACGARPRRSPRPWERPRCHRRTSARTERDASCPCSQA